MTHYSKGQRQQGFPVPVAKVSSSSPLWDWAEVATWLHSHGRLGEEAAEQAAILKAANGAIAGGSNAFLQRLRALVREAALAPA